MVAYRNIYSKFEAILTVGFGPVALTSEPGILVDSKLATHTYTSMSVAIIKKIDNS